MHSKMMLKNNRSSVHSNSPPQLNYSNNHGRGGSQQSDLTDENQSFEGRKKKPKDENGNKQVEVQEQKQMNGGLVENNSKDP